MPTIETINLITAEIDQASSCLLETVSHMRKLSSSAYSTERDQIVLTIGRLQILAHRVSNEDIST